jgi:serine/threonine-protein kinase mTOR
MLRTLLTKADDKNPTVAANVLMCLGELTMVAGEDALPYVPDLMTVIMARLGDANPPKRDAALHTLGQVCSATGYVITPLNDYPGLMHVLERILRMEANGAVRREVIKVLGILGAVDPYRRKGKIGDDARSLETALIAVNQVPVNQSTPPSAQSEDYSQTVVITSLLGILNDPALGTHHHTVIEAIMSIFKTQGLKCVSFLPQV